MTFVLMFFTYAFLGWILEVVFYLYKHHKFVNRGFVNGPLVPIYGLSALSLHLLVIRLFDADFSSFNPLRLIIVFVLISLVTSLLELVGGALLYRFFKARWWDYSKERFNYKGFVSLKYSLIWGVMGTILFTFVHVPYIYPYLDALSPTYKRVATYFLGSYLIVDMTLTIFMLFDFKTRIILLKSRLEMLLVNTETYMDAAKTSQITNAKKTLRSALYALKNNRPMGEVRERLDALKRYFAVDSDEKAKQEYGKIRSLLVKLSTSHLTKGFPNLKINLKDNEKKDKKASDDE
ncbi:MAG: putative ABC transporter permease [Bacillota bacterium]